MKSKRLLRGWLFAVFMANNFFLSAHVPLGGLQQDDLKPKELDQAVVAVASRGGRGGSHRGGGRSSGGFRGGSSGFRGSNSHGASSGSRRMSASPSQSRSNTSTSRPRTAGQPRTSSRKIAATSSRPQRSSGVQKKRSGRVAKANARGRRGSRGHHGRRGRSRWGGRGLYRGGYWRHAGFAFGFGVGLGVGIGFGPWGSYFYDPLAPFWGPRVGFGWGGYYYANYGCWYYGPGRYWYYPWNGCFFYPNYACWYYPTMGVTVYYEPKKADRYAIVDNDDSRDAYFALYYKEKAGNGYNLYGVGAPQIISGRETVKVVLPSYGSPKDFIVIVDRDRDSFKEMLVQDEKGNLVKDREVSVPRPSAVKDVDLVIEKVDKNAPELKDIRAQVHTQKNKLLEVEKLAKEARTDDNSGQKQEALPAAG